MPCYTPNKNLTLWGFTMLKGFGIGQHIREIPGTSNVTQTFGHTVVGAICDG